MTRKSQDHFGIGGIAAEGYIGHQEVIAHQKSQQAGLVFAKSESFGRCARDAFPHQAVVFDLALADIVKKDRQVQQIFSFDLVIDLRQ